MVTIPCCFLTALIGAVYTDIENVIAFLGGVIGVLHSYSFPAFVYVRSKNQGYHWKNILTVTISTILTLIGFFAGALTLVDIVKGKASAH